jgi:hypothetical protein
MPQAIETGRDMSLSSNIVTAVSSLLISTALSIVHPLPDGNLFLGTPSLHESRSAHLHLKLVN